MAKISIIKPYKFVNPNLITGKTGGVKKGGATIIAAGKKITGPGMTGGDSTVKMGRVTLLATNRIGATVTAIAQTQTKIGQVLLYESKIIQANKDFRRKRQQYYKDQESEAKNEQGLKAKENKGLSEDLKKDAEKKVKEKKSWLDDFFSPFKGIVEFVVGTMVTQGVLRWVADPKNGDKLQSFINNLATVFNFIYNVAYKSIDFFLTGVSNVFGDGSEQGFGRFKQVMTGLGQILIGIAGFKALSYLLNPFALVGDLIGLLDFFGNTPAPGGPSLPPGTPEPKPKPKPNAPKKPKSFLGKIGDSIGEFGKGLWGKFKGWGNNVTKGMRDKLAKSGEFLKETTQKAMRPILDKAYKFLNDKGIIKMAKGFGDKAVGLIKKVPGYEKIANKVAKEGGEKMLGKLGGKAIPIIGGLVNLYFAYDRLKSGDKSGAALEALSGILDIAGLFTAGSTSVVSMIIDSYLFGRDFFPDVVKKENEVFGNLINAILGPIKGIKDSLPKLPMLAEGGLVTKPTIAGLGENGPELVVPLGKIGSLGGTTGILAGGMESALQRMGAAGDIARQVIGNDLKAAEQAFGAAALGGAGGDTLGKSVIKAGRGMSIDAGDDISLFLGKDNIVITDKKKGSASTTTLRGQLANVLSSLIWLGQKDISSGSGSNSNGTGGNGGNGGTTTGSSSFEATAWKDDPEFANAVNAVAKHFNIRANDLLGLMASESGLNPAAGSHHVGLIQFSPGAARGAGTTQAKLKKMSRAQQMPYVQKYLENVGLPKGSTAGHLYTAVFLPAFVNKPADFVIATKDGSLPSGYPESRSWYSSNSGLDMNKDGRLTIGELGERINKKKREFRIPMAKGGELIPSQSAIEDRKKKMFKIRQSIGRATGGFIKVEGDGSGWTGTLTMHDKGGAKVGKSYKARSGQESKKNVSQKDRHHTKMSPHPDGTYSLLGGDYHGYVMPGLGDWSVYIGNSSGSLGSRSGLMFHNDIGNNGTAGCIGIDVGGSSGTPADKEFWKRYQEIKPSKMLINLLGKGAGKVDNLGDQQQTGGTGTTTTGGSAPSEDDSKNDIQKMIEAFDKFAAPESSKLNLAPSSAGEGVSYAGAKPATNAFSGNASIKPTSSAFSGGASIASSSQNFQVQDAIDSSKVTVLPIPINTTGNVQVLAGGAPPVIRVQSQITRGFG
jgi:hypothetical protein